MLKASERGNVSVVKLLLEAKAKVDVPNKVLFTAVANMTFCVYGATSLATCMELFASVQIINNCSTKLHNITKGVISFHLKMSQ